MTKGELIRDLELYVKGDKLRDRWNKEVRHLTDAVDRAKSDPYQEELSDDDYLTALGVAVIPALLFAWLSSFFMGIMVFILAFFYVIAIKGAELSTENNRRAEQRKKEAAQLPELERRLRIALTNQKEANNLYARARQYASQHLPDSYMYGYCAERFLSYLKNGRADTLKEAINLYEMESRQEDIYEENRRHNQEMERQQQRQNELAAEAVAEASRAADASEEAARNADFWGAVNTYQLEEILHKK